MIGIKEAKKRLKEFGFVENKFGAKLGCFTRAVEICTVYNDEETGREIGKGCINVLQTVFIDKVKKQIDVDFHVGEFSIAGGQDILALENEYENFTQILYEVFGEGEEIVYEA